MTAIRVNKEKERSFTRTGRVTTRTNKVRRTSNSRPMVVIQKPIQYGYFDTMTRYAFLNSLFSTPSRTIRETVIIRENGGVKRMTENEIRDSIKEQVGMIIDDIFVKISNANDLKSESKYTFTISMTNPTTNELSSKKISLRGGEIMEINNFIKKNPVKAAAIRKVLKKECWKVVHSIIKERIL